MWIVKRKTITMNVTTDEDRLLDAILEAMDYEGLIKIITRIDEEIADWDFTMKLVEHFTALAKEHEADVAKVDGSPTNMDYARAVEAHGALDVAITISKTISLIDVSKTARSASGDEIGDAYLNDVREMLLELIGIRKEEP